MADTAGFIRGNVTLDGKPASGVVVELRGEGGGSLRTTSGADGAFAFARVWFGHYTISAQAPGAGAARTELDVSTDAIVKVSLSLLSLREVGHTSAVASAGSSGTPVSVHRIGRAQIAALPVKNSLNSLVETVPGVVSFSYNEPVAHGFHGLTYEIDGAPLPQSTSSNFAEIIDPHDIDSLEVFTGAIPAEFGGNRIGAVVNVVSKRPSDLTRPTEGELSVGAGSYGAKQANLTESFALGASRLFVNANTMRSDRGLDSPTFVPEHDTVGAHDQFVRFIAPTGKRGTLAFDVSNAFSAFEIPTNATFNPNDPVLQVPGVDDVQREYYRFANVVFTENSPDGRGYFQVIPWASYSRTAYDGDLSKDTQSGAGGLRQDRRSAYGGLRASYFHEGGRHALKLGWEGNYENFTGATLIAQAALPNFTDNISKRGTQMGAYVQDKWEISRAVTANVGLRYDRSNGFTSGNQLSPRVEVNVAPDPKNVVHVYYGRFYAAPFLEDTRCDAVVATGAGSCDASTLPAYDLQPERDSYYEGGVSHTFAPGFIGSFNYWERNVANALDTTQIFPTPIFAVFNNAIGRAEGAEVRLEDKLAGGDSWFFSGTASISQACGISGGTFLFTPDQLSCSPGGLQPEDHDQTYAVNSAYTHRFGARKVNFATVQALYGSGYPVQFESGPSRLPSHLTFNASVGRDAGRGGSKSLGYALEVQNLTGRAYLLKINNGFNTTQWAPGFQALLRLTAPL